jgi:hypothetical protein
VANAVCFRPEDERKIKLIKRLMASKSHGGAVKEREEAIKTERCSVSLFAVRDFSIRKAGCFRDYEKGEKK